jgi:hypothetical protein
MAFPTTPVLDNFNRTEAPLSNGGTWTSPIYTGDGALQANGTIAIPNGAVVGEDYWNVATFTDAEVYCDLVANGTDKGVYLYFRLVGAPAPTAGYVLSFLPGNGTINLINAATGATISGIATGHTMADGDSIGASIIGSTITGYYKPAAGSWTVGGTWTNTTFAAAGNIGIGFATSGASGGIDNFGGGAVVTATAPVYPVFLPRTLGPAAVGPTFFAALQSAPPPTFSFTDVSTGAIIFGGVAGDAWTLQTPSVSQYLPFSLGPVTPLFFAAFPPAPSPAALLSFADTVTGAIIFGGGPGEAWTFQTPFVPQYLPRSLGPVSPLFFAPLQPPIPPPTYWDTATGAIIFGGAPAEGKTGAETPTGAIIFGGGAGETGTFSVSPTGAIIFGGAPGEAYTLSLPFVNQYLPFSLGPATPLFFARFPPAPNPAASGLSFFTDTVTGAIIFGGVPGELKTYADARTGAIIFGGVSGDAKIVADSRTGAIIFGGTLTELKAYADARGGVLIFGGTVIGEGPVHLFGDLPIGVLIFNGTIVDVFLPPVYPTQHFRNAMHGNIS